YRLYLYLTKLDPLNSNFQELTEPREIIERLGINRDTFFVGIAKLKELGLYDLKEKLSLSKQITRKTNRRYRKNVHLVGIFRLHTRWLVGLIRLLDPTVNTLA
ncbi:MAG: hypothetical protein QUS12_07295, partial [Methanosarcina sp.]|nr:hypothetical protein [Methanosarcina sp.]